MTDQVAPTAQMAGRKLLELREKLAGVGAEFERWLQDAGEARPLRKHRSQIERLTQQLGGLAARVEQEIDGLSPDDDDVLAACREVQLRILEVHRLWDYFRAKLNLRYVDWFQRYLLVADEFAWACYKPAQDAADPSVAGLQASKEAPLVFLSGEFSPFTHPRQNPFQVEDVSDALNSVEFLQVAYALPIPVIGLPWYQVAHLPDAVLIAHEVGHDVERDFRLTSTTESHLRTALGTVPGPRRNGWFAWLPEVFADLYGVLAAGPAFVSALVDLLATDPVQVAAEAVAGPPWMPHPPASLRVAITTRALERTKFATAATAQRDAWKAVFDPSPDGPFADDVNAVTDGLLSGQYPQFGDRTLLEVISFTPAQQQAAADAAESVLGSMQPGTADIRCLVACARLAFADNPAGYQSSGPGLAEPQDLILDRATGVIGDDPRGEAEVIRPTAEQDRKAGAALFDLIDEVKRGRKLEPNSDTGGEDHG